MKELSKKPFLAKIFDSTRFAKEIAHANVLQ